MSSVSITEFREAVQTELARDLEIKFLAGKLPRGSGANGEVGCCWAAAKAEVQGQVDEEEIELVGRVWPRRQDVVAPERPADPEPLEQLAEKIQAAIRDRSATLGPWLTRLVRLELDHDEQMVEFSIYGRQDNRGLKLS